MEEKFDFDKIVERHGTGALKTDALHLDHDALVALFVKGARLALNDGEIFGKEGAGFMRLNVGCPRSVIAEALKRQEKAVHSPAGISTGTI